MKKRKQIFHFIVFFILVCFFCFCNLKSNEKDNVSSLMKIHYLDVGQGDSTFLELPNGEVMLIDAAESTQGDMIIQYIKKLGYSKIDYIICTHPHADHIGGMAQVMRNFEIGEIYMPKVATTTKTVENLLNTIKEKEATIYIAKAGIHILNEEHLKIDILAPNRDTYSNLNNYSAVLKITFQNTKFLFMGDAEEMSENEITQDVQADVIKVGHHGSDTSSSQSFVDNVKAEYAILSVGLDNSYHHPSQTILERWQNANAKIYRTDLNGTILITTDGKTIEINPERK